jgi:sorbin and SH3 domain-containing protein 1
MLDKNELKKEIKNDKLGEKVKLRYIETRLEETANDLQKVIDQLEEFGKNRSKSSPEIAWKLRNSNGKFSYLTGQKPSTSGTGHAPENENINNPLTKGINEMKKLTMEEVLQRQRAEKLSEELDDQRNRRHGYFPGASPALQNNVQRFDHFLHQEQQPTANNYEYSSSRCSTPARRGYSQGPIQTCTVLYKFTAQNPRELSLNRGDVVRVNREIDSNWIEGERNGNVGIFPASYVQMDEDPSTSRNRVRVLYPFQARNRNELSLKRGELLRRRREIDANWFEGTNSKGQIGIFPKCYVQDYIEGVENGDDSVAGSVIPDRPKTPKITTASQASRAQSPSPSKKANLDRSQQIQQHEQRRQNFSGPARMVPKNAETYRALYPYKPEHSDELALEENDIIFVVEKCDDGWFIGTLLRTGQFGTFPGNYVEKH